MESRVRPDFWQLVGHIYLDHPAISLITVGIAVGAGLALGPGAVKEMFNGQLREALAYMVLFGMALLPLAGQTWFLGSEGWSPVDKYNYYRLWGDHGGKPLPYEQWQNKK